MNSYYNWLHVDFSLSVHVWPAKGACRIMNNNEFPQEVYVNMKLFRLCRVLKGQIPHEQTQKPQKMKRDRLSDGGALARDENYSRQKWKWIRWKDAWRTSASELWSGKFLKNKLSKQPLLMSRSLKAELIHRAQRVQRAQLFTQCEGLKTCPKGPCVYNSPRPKLQRLPPPPYRA